MTPLRYLPALLWALAVLCGCSSGHSDPEQARIKIVHINDVHSHLEPQQLNLEIDTIPIRAEVGGMARVASLIRELRSQDTSSLVLHAGDAVQGTMFCTLFGGAADADVLNSIAFDAFTLGNHEFDAGDAWLADFLQRLECPKLSANLSVGKTNPLKDLYRPYLVKNVNGNDIGIIGVTIGAKTQASSFPGPDVVFSAEAEAVQNAVDELEAAGVGKIILLSHYGYPDILRLVAQVDGVDVVVDGDSHTLMGDFSPHALPQSPPYPVITTNRAGEQVCIVQAWENTKIVGELDVLFRGDSIAECRGTPHLVLGEQFWPLDEDSTALPLSGAELEELHAAIEADPCLSSCTDDPTTGEIINSYSAQMEQLTQQVIGTAPEDLPHIRIPDPSHPNPGLARGSAIAPLVARAFYARIPDADLALINAGAVRTDLYAGDITYATLNNLMPFSATLVHMQISGAELRFLLEEGLEYIASGGSSGSFLYAYGIRYAVDAREAFGKRFSALEIRQDDAGTYVTLEDNKTYSLVTNSYIAAGKDGYTSMESIRANTEITNTYIDVRQALTDHLQNLSQEGLELSALPPEDHCIQGYIPAPDEHDSP
ncbi:MAG: 5'-nucleotidase C-terminal domain-containing protein [Desulfuromonadaceae bacterium]